MLEVASGDDGNKCGMMGRETKLLRVLISIYTYIYIYLTKYICMYVRVNRCVYIYMFTYVSMYLFAYLLCHVFSYLFICLLIYSSMFVFTSERTTGRGSPVRNGRSP